jgi:hypothetical protein
MGKRSQHISFFFLALLVLIKVSALHVYAHQESDAAFDSCAWCQLALETQHEEYLYTATGWLPGAVVEAPAYAAPVAPETFAARQASKYGRFCRPPPAIL